MIFFRKKLSTLNAFLVDKLVSFDPKRCYLRLRRNISLAGNKYFFGPCYLCGTRRNSDLLICSSCKTDLLSPLSIPTCESCKLPLPAGADHVLCTECRKTPPPYDACYLATIYDFPASTLVHKLKYHNKPFLALLIGQLLAEQRQLSNRPYPDLICCVPMHASKLKTKHYNHAEEIARVAAKELSLPLYPSLLVKTKATESQIKLGRTARLKNLTNSIRVNSEASLKGKYVAVVDDVMTTGATFDLITRLLKARGASKVEVWAFSRTLKPVPK